MFVTVVVVSTLGLIPFYRKNMPAIELLHLALICVTLGVNVLALLLCLNKTGNPYLAVFFIASGINYLDDVFWLLDGWLRWPVLTNLYIPFMLLMAPALYLYLKSLVTENQVFQLKSKHWGPFVLGWFLCLPYYLFDASEKLQRLQATPGTLEHHGLVTWGPTVALMLVIPVGVLYIYWSLGLLRTNLLQVKSFFSNIEDKTLSWVRWAIITLLLAWLVVTAELLLPSALTETGVWMLGFATFELLWLVVFAFFALPQKPILTPQTGTSQGQKTHKYQRAPLTETEVQDISQRLKQAMQQDLLHRQADLSLQSLADHLGVSVNKLSQVLNVHLHEGFYDFINNHRIQDACEQLIHSNHHIIDIAYLVGFNSKSTFNKAFKKHTAMTPSLYKKQHGQGV